MIMLLMFSMMMSSLFIFMNHPLSMGLILLIQVLNVALITGLLSMNFWFSYILFLIMVGGMLVLFIYMTSIASNEKFNYSNKMMIMMMIIMIFMIMMKIFDNMFINMMNLNIENLLNKNIQENIFNKFFNYPSNILLFMMIIYLFITLIAVVKITNINLGPLRQKF
uniref:NADH-ubiquinone oxidoreductase chain 6 n=1 Tax=Atrecus affinis TaxID=347277 RepID=A0A191ZR36_9COLE|nr:NADH dehydrogenase subunit 6 [Atrecus affinis]